MKNKFRVKPILLILALIAFLASAYYVKSILLSKQKKCSDEAIAAFHEELKGHADTPSYISSYWPTEPRNIALSCYMLTTNTFTLRRGIGVIIRTDDIAENEIAKTSDNNLEPFEDRIYLFIDGDEATNSSKMVIDNIAEVIVIKNGAKYFSGISSGYELSWTPFILPGQHTAKIEIRTKSGKIFEFEWQFAIVTS